MNEISNLVEHPEGPVLDRLCELLADSSDQLATVHDWPARQLSELAASGVYRWFVPAEYGGVDWSIPDIARGYLRLGAACLTTTFVLTQWAAAVRRLQLSENESLRSRLLPELAAGKCFATVGISHLTTSSQHLQRPVLRARQTRNGFVLDGFSPWVTGAPFADWLVTGATMDDAQQVLMAVPASSARLRVGDSQSLVALSASRTGAVHFDKVEVDASFLVAGPQEQVMSSGGRAGTGGLQTSTLALALARAALDYLQQESSARDDLAEKAESLRTQWDETCHDLLELANGNQVCSPEQLRTAANSLVLRSTQAALVAAKGAGFVEGHPVGRWCREALFFLVWSCPQGVRDANLCELAGIES